MFTDTTRSVCLGKGPMKDGKGETWYCACRACDKENPQEEAEEIADVEVINKKTNEKEVVGNVRKRRTKAEMEAARNAI